MNTAIPNNVFTQVQLVNAEKKQQTTVKQAKQQPSVKATQTAKSSITLSAYGQQQQASPQNLATQQHLQQLDVSQLKAAMAKKESTFGKVTYKAAENAATQRSDDNKPNEKKKPANNPFANANIQLAGQAKNGSNPFAVMGVLDDNPRQQS